MEFRFETKIGCFVTRICTFAHSYSLTHFTNIQDTRFIVERSPHSHLQRYIFKSVMLMNVFNSPYFFVNIPVIPVHFNYFIFCFKFYYPNVDIIVNHLYHFFSVCVKPMQNVVKKKKEKTQRYDIKQLIRSVAKILLYLIIINL